MKMYRCIFLVGTPLFLVVIAEIVFICFFHFNHDNMGTLPIHKLWFPLSVLFALLLQIFGRTR
jgi:hypothetical protein